MNRSRRATVFPCSLFVFTLLLGCGSDETSGDDSAAGSTGKDGTGGTGGTTSHVLFVDQAASEGGDGTSWAQAFTELGDALEVVGASGATEIWVAAGTYTPTHAPVELYQSFDRSENADGSCGDTSGTDFSDERWNTFLMRSGVAIYGGFAGTELERDERDWTANVTILSGDLDANDCYTTESCGAPLSTSCDGTELGYVASGESYGDNVYHVVTGAEDAVLDGVTVRGGNTDASVQAGTACGLFGTTSDEEIYRILSGFLSMSGGGIFIGQSDPTIRNSTIEYNRAGKRLA